MATAEHTVQMALEAGRQGRPHDGIALLRRLQQKLPNNLMIGAVLGQLLMQAGEAEQAVFQFERCARADPKSAAHMNNYAMALGNAGKSSQAVAAFRESVRLDPAYAKGWVGLAMQLLRVPDYQGAAEAARTAIQVNPDLAEAYHNLGLALLESGQASEAVSVLRESLRRAPDHPDTWSALLIALTNTDLLSPEDLRKEHEQFGRMFPTTAAAASTRKDPERRLRIGVLSSDFRTHSVMYFFEPFLEHHDRTQFDLVCLAASPAADRTTARLRGHAAAWISAAAPDDAALDRLIREHRIDILIELAGHSAGNRLPALRNKPAPIIVSAIGYANTTGLPSVDYRLIDSLTDPAGSESHATERLVRLDPCFLCYRPPAAPQVAIRSGSNPIVFGSFNALPKLSPRTLRVWSELLRRVPNSSILLKAGGLQDPWARQILLAAFDAAGIGRERVELLSQTAGLDDHLALYSRVDIALDPFPYNGTTTTCEALWMGVPVVALSGDHHAARVGVTLLTAAGLPDLIADSEEHYVSIAAALASDRPRLESLRATLRPRMTASVLCDGPAYARRFERALRRIWREYCGVVKGHA